MRRVVLVVVVLLAGCGGGGASSGDASATQQIRTSVKDFVASFAGLRFGEACNLMTAQAKAQIGQGVAGNCVDQLSYLRTLLAQSVIDELAADVDKGRITVHGDTATSTKVGGRLGFTAYRRVGGRWLIDAGR